MSHLTDAEIDDLFGQAIIPHNPTQLDESCWKHPSTIKFIDFISILSKDDDDSGLPPLFNNFMVNKRPHPEDEAEDDYPHHRKEQQLQIDPALFMAVGPDLSCDGNSDTAPQTEKQFNVTIFDDDNNDGVSHGYGDHNNQDGGEDEDEDEEDEDEDEEEDEPEQEEEEEEEEEKTKIVRRRGGARKLQRPRRKAREVDPHKSRAKNLGLKETSINTLTECIVSGMPLRAYLRNAYSTVKFAVTLQGFQVGEVMGDYNTLTFDIPHFSDNGVDVHTQLLDRYNGPTTNKDEAVKMIRPDPAHPSIFEFSAPISVKLNLYTCSQLRGNDGGTPGGFSDNLCMRENRSNGAGSKIPREMSLVVLLPDEADVKTYVDRQMNLMDICSTQAPVTISLSSLHSKKPDLGCGEGFVVAYDKFSSVFIFEIDRDKANTMLCPILASKNIERDTDKVLVINDTTIEVGTHMAILFEDSSTSMLAKFRCAVRHPEKGRIPAIATLSLPSVTTKAIKSGNGHKKQKIIKSL